MRAALIQLCSGDDPAANLSFTLGAVREAAAGGANLVFTPECTNMVSTSRARQRAVLRPEAEDATLAGLQNCARDRSVWLVVGSLLLAGEGERFVNRSLVIAPDGTVRARYDKIHMFDVELEGGENYRESAAYRPGDRAVLAETAGVRLGLSVCYDLRFAALYRSLAQAGAQVLTVPSAFTVPTGEAHWHVLLRARAIETGCFVLAPAQTGEHAASEGKSRRTYGHSLAVAPWGEVIADAGTEPGVTLVDLDLTEVARAQARVPSLHHDARFEGPEAG